MKVLCNIDGTPVLPLCIFEDKEAAEEWISNMLSGNNWFTDSCGVTECMEKQESENTLLYIGANQKREFKLRSILDFIKY